MDEKDKKIARLEELLQSIKDNIDETESVLDSLSNSELQAENDNDLPAIISSLKILFSPYATQKNKYPEIHYAHNSVLMKENIYSFRQNA